MNLEKLGLEEVSLGKVPAKLILEDELIIAL